MVVLTDEVLFQITVVAILGAAAFIGWRSTWRSYRRHLRIAPTMPGWIFLISLSHVVIRLISSAAASWFGVLAARRLLGLEPIDWSPVVSWVIAVVVFFMPSLLDWTERKIASDDSLDIPAELGS